MKNRFTEQEKQIEKAGYRVKGVDFVGMVTKCTKTDLTITWQEMIKIEKIGNYT